MSLEEKTLKNPRPSSSVKDAEIRSRRKQRSCSFPRVSRRKSEADQTFEDANRLCRMRSFRTTKQGVVNNGDSFRKASCSSLMSSGSTVALDDGRRLPSTSSVNASDNSDVSRARRSSTVQFYYRIAFLGGNGVGKSSIIKQCLSSESGSSNEAEQDGGDETGSSIYVQLDGEEYLIELLDDITVRQCEESHVDAYVVVFAVTATTSFKEATVLLQQLRLERGCDRAVILVANKVDLVRQRRVDTEEIRTLATIFDCKCLEVSSVLNLNIDNLIVGIIKQIRIKLRPPVSATSSDAEVGNSDHSHRDKKKTNIFLFVMNHLLRHTRRNVRIRSCENLLR